MSSFRERAEQWQRDAPIRAAQRAKESRARRVAGKTAGAVLLIVMALLAVAAIGLLVLAVLSIAAVWKLLFAIGVVALAGLAWREVSNR